VIENSDVNEEWCDKCFWRNEVISDPTTHGTATLRRKIQGVPRQWRVERTETPAGLLERHFFGPFAAEENLEGPHGVSRCTGGDVWKNAATLLGRVWPAVSGKKQVFSENASPV